MRLLTFLLFTSSLAWIFLVTVAEDQVGSTGGVVQDDSTSKNTTTLTEATGENGDDSKGGTSPDLDDESMGGSSDTENKGNGEPNDPPEGTTNNGTDIDTNQNSESQGSDKESSGTQEEEEKKVLDEESEEEKDTNAKKDDLNDNPEVVDPDSIADDTNSRFHTVKLMLYIIAPVSALVVVYFIMKGLKGNSRMFLNRYHIVGARGDNIELRPLGYESDEEEEDVVFDSSRHT